MTDKNRKPESVSGENENHAPVEPVKLDDNVYRDPVFYYSRGNRLSRASPIVQSLNEGKPLRQGFSKTLFASRANLILFLTVILLCGMFGLASRFSVKDRGIKLGGNTVALTMLREGELLILGIVKNASESGEVYTGAVDVAVSPVLSGTEEAAAPEEPPVFVHRIFFNPSELETYHLSLPFGGDDFFVLLKTDFEQKTARLKI